MDTVCRCDAEPQSTIHVEVPNIETSDPPTARQEKRLLKNSEMKEDHETPERPTWANSTEFLLNIMGYSVGIGNVWRFPYLCYKNGGGAFLIPYLIVVSLCGFPLLLLELSLGQYTGKGALGTWDIVPALKGIATSSLLIGWFYVSYTMVLMGWFIFYFVHCFTTSPLPWSICDNSWNTNSCVPVFQFSSENGTNSSDVASYANISESRSSVKEFWTEYVLRKTDGIEDMGSLSNWRAILCWLCAWTISYFCILKGIKTSGKVVYFTVITPYIMLLVLLIRGLTLEGAADGILYYITPRTDKLADSSVWLEAGGQALYTLGICCLSLYTFGSHNKFHTNCYKFALINILGCCGTSIFVGFVIFSYLGNIAHQEGKNITDVAEGGPGLVFEVFPASLAHLPAPQIWSAIFFFTLILVAIDSAFGCMEGFVSFLHDFRPKFFVWPGEQVCRIGMNLLPFLLGVPMLLDGGIYVFELINMYGNSGIVYLLTSFVEIVGISWVYGVDRFFGNIKQMIGYRPNIFVKYCYLYFGPGLTLSIFIAFCAQYSPLKNGDYEYPAWANAVGWILSMVVVIAIPATVIKTLIGYKGTLLQRWYQATASKLLERKEFKDFIDPTSK